jgi:hypothetical protein
MNRRFRPWPTPPAMPCCVPKMNYDCFKVALAHSNRHRLDLLVLMRPVFFHAQCCTTKCRRFNGTGHRHIATRCRRHRSGRSTHAIGRVIREYQTCAHVSSPVASKL